MPYAFATHKIKLPVALDRRVKLTADDKERIRSLHKEGMAIRAIAREYEKKCSRRLIQFIIFEDRAERSRDRLKKWQEKNGNFRQRVGNEEWARVMREHRQYKQKALVKVKARTLTIKKQS